jgi:hypothetical protein
MNKITIVFDRRYGKHKPKYGTLNIRYGTLNLRNGTLNLRNGTLKIFTHIAPILDSAMHGLSHAVTPSWKNQRHSAIYFEVNDTIVCILYINNKNVSTYQSAWTTKLVILNVKYVHYHCYIIRYDIRSEPDTI